MTIKLKRLLFTLAASLGLFVPASVPAVVSAQGVNINENLCAGAQFNPDGTCDTGEISGSSSDVQEIIRDVINIFSLVVGVIAVIMIIIGGVKYITSGGDSGNVTGAKNTILYAIIGLVIVALAQTIVFFVLGQTSNL
jgi:cytochrome bd-type quinol oxidase subunit 2